jgi:hypothetical protein
VISLESDCDLETDISSWLEMHQPDATFSLAVLASPVREGGIPEHVLAIDGISIADLHSMLGDLGIESSHQPFASHR